MTSSEIIKIRTKAILEFLTNNPNYQLNSSDWQVFLTVAMDEGVTAPELVQQLQMSQQTISRKIRILGQTVNDAGELEGYDLVRVIPKGKAHSLFLTENGKNLWQDFCEMHSRVDQFIIDQSQENKS